MAITLFYCWQSDRDEKICHYLIRDAVKDAIRRLKAKTEAEAEIEEALPFPDMVVASGTEGVPGTPKVADTIQKRITACDMFLADLTHAKDYVTADGRAKSAQNGNVLIELGLALAQKPPERILLVMNTAFGTFDKLPFDLHLHRRPILYNLPDASDKERYKSEREALTGRLAEAIGVMVDDIEATEAASREVLRAEALARRQEEVGRRRVEFEKAVSTGSYAGFNLRGMEPDLRMKEVRPLLALSIFPMNSPMPRLDLGKLHPRVGKEMRPLFADGWEPEVFARSIVTHTTKTRPSGIRADLKFKQTKSLTELRDDASIVAVEELLPPEIEHNAMQPAALEFCDEERELIMRLRDYVQMLDVTCGVSPPLFVGVSILRPAGIRFHVRKHHGLRQLQDDIIADVVTIPSGFDLKDPAETIRRIAKALKPALDTFWRAAGLGSGDPFVDDDGKFG